MGESEGTRPAQLSRFAVTGAAYLVGARGGRSLALDLGAGDSLVMGDTGQQTWEHALPKVAHAGLRISEQLRSAPVVAARY